MKRFKEVCASCAHASEGRLVDDSVPHSDCFVGAHCTHAILTDAIGVYRCPFGACFKKLANQKREVS